MSADEPGEIAGRATGRRTWARWRKALVVALVFLGLWLPRLAALDRFLTPDENAWNGRAANFWAALVAGDFAGTYQTEHPGVTAMWAGVAGQALVRLGLWRGAEGDANIVAGRAVAGLAGALALTLAFVYAWRLFGLLPGLLGVLLIAFDPFQLAHARVLHLDGLLTSFLLLSLLAFLDFQRQRWLLDLVVSGAAAGLAWLTKTPALFIAPLVALLSVVDLAANLRSRDRPPLPALVWRAIWPLGIWLLVGAAVLIIFWPAMWVEPARTLTRLATEALGHAQGGHGNPIFFSGRIYPTGSLDASVWWFYPTVTLWRSTPVALLGLLAAAAACVWKWRPLDQGPARRALLGLLHFALLYGIFLNSSAKKFERYLLPALAVLDLAAGVGWAALVLRLVDLARPGARGDGVRSKWRGLLRAGALLVLLVAISVQVASARVTFPYYLSYYNPVMGGSQRAPEVLMVGWGEGLDEAGRILRAQARTQDLVVASWYVPCFAPYFPGTVRGIPLERELGGEPLQALLDADYVVVYIHQWQRQMPRQLLEKLGDQEPAYRIEINGLEYVRIYRGHLSP